MMDKSLEQVRGLIRQNRYAEARALLANSNHPEADDWQLILQRLEATSEQTTAASMGLFFTVSAITTGMIFAAISYFVFIGFLKHQRLTLPKK